MPNSMLGWVCLLCLLQFGAPGSGIAADTLNWRTNVALVSADIKAAKLPWLLEQVTSVTGWQVYVEPEVSHTVSAKFQNVAPGEALRLLLGDLNFALIPEATGTRKLFVFRTTMGSATQRVTSPAPPPLRPAPTVPPPRTRLGQRSNPAGRSQ